MREVKEFWQKEIVVRRLKEFRGLWKKKLWNRTPRKRRFSRSEMPFLYVSACQVHGLPTAAIPAPIDPEKWLNMVNFKPPNLADLEVDSMT